MTLPLEGIKVIELATMVAAPMTCRILADWGAEVIKIEHPVTGDPWREWQAWGDIEIPVEREFRWWDHYNRHKRSMTLDMTQERGMDIFRKLVGEADVFVTNKRPMDQEKFGIGYDVLSELNPRIVYASITGFGKKGPEKNSPAHDTAAFWARSGLSFMLQDPGMAPPNSGSRIPGAGDSVTGTTLACGILMALFERERTGAGKEVDVSLLQNAVFIQSHVALALNKNEEEIPLFEYTRIPRDETLPWVTSYQTQDERWLQLALAPLDPYWSGLCRVIERPDLEDDARFETLESKMENKSALFDIMTEIFLGKTLDEWTVLLTEAKLLWAPYRNPREVVDDIQARENNFFIPLDHPELGQIEVVANPIQMNGSPAPAGSPAPEFSQHTEEVLLEFGYSWEDIVELKGEGTIA